MDHEGKRKVCCASLSRFFRDGNLSIRTIDIMERKLESSLIIGLLFLQEASC